MRWKWSGRCFLTAGVGLRTRMGSPCSPVLLLPLSRPCRWVIGRRTPALRTRCRTGFGRAVRRSGRILPELVGFDNADRGVSRKRVPAGFLFADDAGDVYSLGSPGFQAQDQSHAALVFLKVRLLGSRPNFNPAIELLLSTHPDESGRPDRDHLLPR